LVHRRKQATHKPSLTRPFLQVAVNTSRCTFAFVVRSCKHFTLSAKTLALPLTAQTRVRAHVTDTLYVGDKVALTQALPESFGFLTNTIVLLFYFHPFIIWGMVKDVDKSPVP
jgi:hypothetical protein